jgi:hypothetical protein
VRYDDDFVVLAKQMRSEVIGYIESRLEGKFQLEINREKTRVVDLREAGASLRRPVFRRAGRGKAASPVRRGERGSRFRRLLSYSTGSVKL